MASNIDRSSAVGAIGAAERALSTDAGLKTRVAELEAQADWYAEQRDRETATDLRYQAARLRERIR